MYPPDPFANRFNTLRLVGRGGFGVVYRAWDTELEREVALKLLNANLASDPDFRKRFKQEATAASKLNHPNITIVYDRGEYQGQPFIVMELVQGEPLSKIIERRTALTDPERLFLIEQLCDGLHYAHQRNIVHRDVKPVNLVVREEHDGTDMVRTLKILDFGIAKIVNAGQSSTGQLMFTPNYVSPEQIRGSEVDRRSDIFAVGAVAYELLVSEKAFVIRTSNPFALLEEVKLTIAERPHRPMTDVRPDVDPELVAIVDRALEKIPEDRYSDLAEMRSRVREVRERMLAEESGQATIRIEPKLQEEIRLARESLKADNPTAAVERLEQALALAPDKGVRRFIELELAEARDRQSAQIAERKARDERAAAEAISAARAAFELGDGPAAISALEQFEPRPLVAEEIDRLTLRERDESERAQQVVDAARDLFRHGRWDEAIAALEEAEFPSRVARVLQQLRDAAGLVRHATVVVQTALPGERAQALEQLEAYAERWLIEPALADLKALDGARRSAELEAAASAIVEAAVADFESGNRLAALDRLEQFEPRHPRVVKALDRLRERNAELEAEERARAEAEELVARVRVEFAHGHRNDAIAALVAFDRSELVAPALAELRRAAEAVDAATETVQHGAREARKVALATLARVAPPDLVSEAVRELQGLALARDADEDRAAEQAASSRAQDAVELARRIFRTQGAKRAKAITGLERFDDAPRVAAALDQLRGAKDAIDTAAAVVASGDPAARGAALERLAMFADGELVAEALVELRTLDEARRAAEDHDRAAAALIDSVREQFDGGDRPGALARLEQFQPPHDAVTAALAELQERAAQLEEAQRELDARDLVATARATFAEGQRAAAIAGLELKSHWPLVAAALQELLRADDAIEVAEQAIEHGNEAARSEALAELARFEPANLVDAAARTLRELADQRTADERALREAAVSMAAQARALFVARDTDEAFAVLEAFPAPALVADVVEELRRADDAIKVAGQAIEHGDEAARSEALAELARFEPANLVDAAARTLRALADQRTADERALREAAVSTAAQARALFAAGEPAEALAVLGAFPAPALVADALDTLRQAAAEIDAARKSVATGAAPARQAALARLAGWEPFDLIERALTELRGLDEERTAEDARVEALRVASAAERTVNDARAAFLRGEYESAIRALEDFEVPHLVDGTLAELGQAHQAIERARHAVTGGDDDTRQRAIDALRSFTPSALVARAMDQLLDEHLKRRAAEKEEQERYDRELSRAREQIERGLSRRSVRAAERALRRAEAAFPTEPIWASMRAKVDDLRAVRAAEPSVVQMAVSRLVEARSGIVSYWKRARNLWTPLTITKAAGALLVLALVISPLALMMSPPISFRDRSVQPPLPSAPVAFGAVDTPTAVILKAGKLPVNPGTGLLVIDALPWAEILEVRDVENEPVLEAPAGMFTPFALDVPAGRYTVTLRGPGSSKPRVVEVEVSTSGGSAVAEFRPIDPLDYFKRAGS